MLDNLDDVAPENTHPKYPDVTPSVITRPVSGSRKYTPKLPWCHTVSDSQTCECWQKGGLKTAGPLQLMADKGLEWCQVVPVVILVLFTVSKTGRPSRWCQVIRVTSSSDSVIHAIVCSMPFLPQPSQVILAWDRHWILLTCTLWRSRWRKSER